MLQKFSDLHILFHIHAMRLDEIRAFGAELSKPTETSIIRAHTLTEDQLFKFLVLSDNYLEGMLVLQDHIDMVINTNNEDYIPLDMFTKMLMLQATLPGEIKKTEKEKDYFKAALTEPQI